MPTYAYLCPECGTAFDRTLPVSAYKDPQHCACGALAAKQVTSVAFNLPGDDWPGKNLRVQGQMQRKNAILTERSRARLRDGSGGVTLAPNVGGERVESWSEAKRLAESQGKHGGSYDSLIQKADRPK